MSESTTNKGLCMVIVKQSALRYPYLVDDQLVFAVDREAIGLLRQLLMMAERILDEGAPDA